MQKSFSRINVYRNEDDKYFQIPMEEELTYAQFQQLCSKRLNIKVKRIFSLDGKEIKDIQVIKIIKNVIVTEGEDFSMKKSRVSTAADYYTTAQLNLPVTNSDQVQDNNNNISIVMMGNSTVGKSSITQRYINNVFSETHQSTIQDKYMKNEIVDGQQFEIELFDTAGEEDYKGLRNIWMKSKDAVIFVYAVDDPNSYQEISNLYFELQQLYSENKMPQIALVGNKCDTERLIDSKKGKNLAEKLGAIFLETSAKNNVNIKNLFINVIQKVKIFRDLKQLQVKKDQATKQTNDQSIGSDGCKFCQIF